MTKIQGPNASFSGKISIVGCQGVIGYSDIMSKDLYTAGPYVQKHIGEAASNDDSDFIILAGDNFYDDGPKGEDLRGSFDASRFKQAWNYHMPNRYYRLVSEKQNTIFYFLDSNCLPFDEPQQEWFEKAYHDDAKAHLQKNKILVMHHPVMSAGKRFGKTKDVDMYARTYGVSPPDDSLRLGDMGQLCA